MTNAKQTIAIAGYLATDTTAQDAWDAWMKDIEGNGGDMDAAGCRAFAEYLVDQRSPTAHDEAKALRRLAQLMEANQ